MTRQLQMNWIGLAYIGLLVLVLMFRATGALGAEPAARDATNPRTVSPADAVSTVRGSLDAALRKPLAERVPVLEQLEKQTAAALFKQGEEPKQRFELYRLQYRVQKNLAKYPEAHTIFGQYAGELRKWNEHKRAQTTICDDVRHCFEYGDKTESEVLANAALEHWLDDSDVAPELMYWKARSLSKLSGRAKEAVPVLEKVITDYPDSPWRPYAMRWLAHMQANCYAGDYKEGLKTLALMEEQYKGTWWEQYAHMKPAILFEVRMGEPQKALQRYQETLVKFPDHKFAPFCRREIERLQKVIEQQLIQDALKGLTQKTPNHDTPAADPNVTKEPAPTSTERSQTQPTHPAANGVSRLPDDGLLTDPTAMR